MPSMLEIIKRASLDAVESTDPTRVVYGLVESASPLSILVDQRLSLSEEFLTLTRNVSKYTTKISMPKDSEFIEAEIDNSLKAGDKVVLIQAQGGQDFIVLDKVV